MKKNLIFIYIYLFISINSYCEGDHNRNDLNKKECAKYEIEQEEIGSNEKLEDYECCYVFTAVTEECIVYSKKLGNKIITEVFLNSPLNIFGGDIQCSYKYLSFNVIDVIQIILLFLFLN